MLRLIDANINRAAEGLRTVEDICRLIHEDRAAAQWSKQLRHELADVCNTLPRIERLAARSAATDAGTRTTLESEQNRLSWKDVVAAAAERVTQSLRNLEEFSKFQPGGELSTRCKQLRYAAYDTLAAIELRLNKQLPASIGRLMLLIDCSLELDSFVIYLRKLAAAGVDHFQLRDKSAEGGKLMRYATAGMATLAADASKTSPPATLFINDRVDIAMASGAAGVHIGQDDLALADARRLARGQLRIGVSTHDIDQALAAERGGADYIGCGPTFASTTKQFNAFAGVDFLKQVAAAIDIPAFAIGGIDLTNVGQVLAAGCQRIAVSSAIHRQPSPVAAAQQLAERLNKTHTP